MKNWLRPASLGFLDGTVTNISMLAFSLGVSPVNAMWFGIAGWLAGSISMGINEYSSVDDQNRAEGTSYSPLIAALSSFGAFSAGSLLPLIPLAFGASPLVAIVWGLILTAIAGSVLSVFTKRHPLLAGLRMLVFAVIAVTFTLVVSYLIGVQIA